MVHWRMHKPTRTGLAWAESVPERGLGEGRRMVGTWGCVGVQDVIEPQETLLIYDNAQKRSKKKIIRSPVAGTGRG